jgi:hypothetical protein
LIARWRVNYAGGPEASRGEGNVNMSVKVWDR